MGIQYGPRRRSAARGAADDTPLIRVVFVRVRYQPPCVPHRRVRQWVALHDMDVPPGLAAEHIQQAVTPGLGCRVSRLVLGACAHVSRYRDAAPGRLI
jgi:hypothetical protein